MTATIHMLPVKHSGQNVTYLPDPALVTGGTAKQLTVARQIAGRVQLGQPLSLPAILTALEVLESHGKGKRDADLALILEAAAVPLRRDARDTGQCGINPNRGNIRAALFDCTVIVFFAVAVIFVGMVA